MPEKVIIFCEDKYGVGFFKALTNELKVLELIPNLHISATKFYGPCNPKIRRQLIAKARLSDYNYFLIIADADGDSQEKIDHTIAVHIPSEFRDFTNIIVCQFEIEEWICISYGIRIDNKPSVILRQKHGYEKHKLEDYVPKLNIKRLVEESESFRNFVNCIRVCSKYFSVNQASD